jgi:membrane-bound lytic murein transglycosylase B
LSSLQADPEIIELDRSQPEFTRNIWDYLNNASSKARLKKGQAMLQKYKLLFDQIEQRYGVQREIITAIWAMESDFGRNYGSKNVIRSLATLAYASNSKKRADFARNELLLSLKIVQAQKFKAENLLGSWAGAMGQPQFMPSSYLQYAVDYNNDGTKDLWGSVPDVLASIANFLAESGWRKLEKWGEEVVLPKPFDWRLNSSAYQLRFEQWQETGVRRIDTKSFEYPQRQAALFIPAGKNGPIFLVTHNFDVIKRYNKSSSYALAVAHLSNLFVGGEDIQTAWPINDAALSHQQVVEIQMHLNLDGHNSGLADGKIGALTREAIRTWQLENGYAGDGYANVDFLMILKKKSRKTDLDQ